MRVEIKNVELSLEDLLGPEYVQAVCEAQAFLNGGQPADYLAIAREKVEFFPRTYRDRLDVLLEHVGQCVVPAWRLHRLARQPHPLLRLLIRKWRLSLPRASTVSVKMAAST